MFIGSDLLLMTVFKLFELSFKVLRFYYAPISETLWNVLFSAALEVE